MSTWGHVYVIRCHGLYKIGYTNGSVAQRVAICQIGNPYPVSLVCAIPTTLPRVIEQDLHVIYHDHHVRGEWYRLTRANVRDLINQARTAKAAQITDQLRRGYELAGWLDEMDVTYL